MNNLDTTSTGLLIILLLVFGEIIKHATSYFWRKLTNTEKYITKADIKLHMQESMREFMKNWCNTDIKAHIQENMKEFMKSWCKGCDTKRAAADDSEDIECLNQKVDSIKKILVELAIKGGIPPAEIAELTRSGRK